MAATRNVVNRVAAAAGGRGRLRSRSGGPRRVRRVRSYLAVGAFALALAALCHGHYVKPHGDFFDLRETGRALLAGHMPATSKRAPLFPLFVTATGRVLAWLPGGDRPPDQRAAELINAALLVVNTLLIAALAGARRGRGAAWVACWFALLPVGLHLTAHALLEPLLVTTILVTLWLAERGSRWAYVAAAAAGLTRLDAAGALLGVAIADASRAAPRAALRRLALAAIPLAAWLAWTAWTWQSGARDHYFAQIAERPTFDPLAPLRQVWACVIPFDRLRAPVWAAELAPSLFLSLRLAVLGCLLIGAADCLRRRKPAALVAGALAAGYWAAHAVFPFDFDRFGYPLAPLFLLGAQRGFRLVAAGFRFVVRSRSARLALAAVASALLVVVGMAEIESAWLAFSRRSDRLAYLPAVALAGVILVWLSTARRRVGSVVLLLAAAVFAGASTRVSLATLGTGQEMRGLVAAARWARDHARRGAVLSAMPGLLRLYAGGAAPDRFIGPEDIAAPDLAGALAECRRRDVRFVIWYEGLIAEHGAYYAAKWRLERFAPLEMPGAAFPSCDLRLLHEFQSPPTRVWILRQGSSP